MEEISLARHFYFPWLLFKMQRLWGQTFPANIFPNEKCSRVRVSDRIYMVSVPHYSDFHRQNFNKSCFQRNYMRLMLFFCQFKITLPLCCALSKWNLPLTATQRSSWLQCKQGRAMKVVTKVPLGPPHMAMLLWGQFPKGTKDAP